MREECILGEEDKSQSMRQISTTAALDHCLYSTAIGGCASLLHGYCLTLTLAYTLMLRPANVLKFQTTMHLHDSVVCNNNINNKSKTNKQQSPPPPPHPPPPPPHTHTKTCYFYLLQFIEAMNLIDEENGLPPKHYSLILGHLYHFLHITHPTGGG